MAYVPTTKLIESLVYVKKTTSNNDKDTGA